MEQELTYDEIELLTVLDVSESICINSTKVTVASFWHTVNRLEEKNLIEITTEQDMDDNELWIIKKFRPKPVSDLIVWLRK